MRYIKKIFSLTPLIILLQVFFSLVFVSSNSLVVDSRLLFYKQTTIDKQYPDQFVHMELTNSDKKISEDFRTFITGNVSRDKNVVSYYLLTSPSTAQPLLKSIYEGAEFSLSSSLLYNPYRMDRNNKYFESFRLRQHFQDVDSRIVKSGYDFNIQLSNVNADKLLTTFNLPVNYETFKDNLFDLTLDIEGTTYKGYVSNVFYIDEDEPVASHLDLYYGNFSTIIISDPIKETANFSLNHAFINSSMRIKNEFVKINALDSANQVAIHDFYGESTLLKSIFSSMNRPYIINYTILSVAIVGFLTTSIGLYLVISRSVKKCFLNVSEIGLSLIMSVLIFSLFIFIGKIVLKAELLYNLSNIYSGIFTIILIFVGLLLIWRYKDNRGLIND